jgi:hypothetical protein
VDVVATAQGVVDSPLDTALDEALDRIAELSRRVRQAQSAHRPRSYRLPYRLGRWRCAGCGQDYPCATTRALDPRLQRSR